MSKRPRAPILFLDVDGVISLFGFERERAPAGAFHWVNGVLHYISRASGEHLRRLGERYELVWATGWEETANEYLPHLLDLPGELPYLRFDGRARFGVAHWKLDAIAEYAGAERPLAWIDDCIDDECRAWAQARGAPTLLVRTSSEDGMRDAHVERLLRFADGLGLPGP